MTTRTTRVSRAQDERNAQPMHEGRPLSDEEIEAALGADSVLPAIPPREGMSQRWVRYRRGNEDDTQNLAKMTRRLWAPRDPATVPKHFQWLVTQREGMGGVIATADVILMERDERIQRRAEQILHDRTNNKTRAVKNNLFSTYKGEIGSDSGFEAPGYSVKSWVERGVPVESPSDE